MLRGRFALLASPRCCASPCLLLLTESSGLQTLRNTKTQRSSLLAYFAHALIGGACADTRHMTDATVCLSLEPLRARQTGRVDEGPAFSAPKSSASYASYAFRDAEKPQHSQKREEADKASISSRSNRPASSTAEERTPSAPQHSARDRLRQRLKRPTHAGTQMPRARPKAPAVRNPFRAAIASETDSSAQTEEPSQQHLRDGPCAARSAGFSYQALNEA